MSRFPLFSTVRMEMHTELISYSGRMVQVQHTWGPGPWDTEHLGPRPQTPCPQAGWRLLLCPHDASHLMSVCHLPPRTVTFSSSLQASSLGVDAGPFSDVSPVSCCIDAQGGWRNTGFRSPRCRRHLHPYFWFQRRDSASINSEQPGAEGAPEFASFLLKVKAL